MTDQGPSLQRTPLYHLHLELGGRMASFAGYQMPIRFSPGTIAEHRHTRRMASLFDVSHMGVIELHGRQRAEALETASPSAFTTLGEGRLRYALLTNESGGIVDDVIVSNDGDRLTLVVNAARKDADLAHLKAHLPPTLEVVPRPDLALLALQGPEAARVLDPLVPGVEGLSFMQGAEFSVELGTLRASRSGYTGEDGFEITLKAEYADAFARQLLRNPEVEPAGLGARDSLRLEAGLCLYGNDLDDHTTPVEASLAWAMQKRRRESGGFVGDAVILQQLANGVGRRRVGLKPEGRAPVRAGASLTTEDEQFAGTVTSGGFGPTVGHPIAMGYVSTSHTEVGTPLWADVRGKSLPVRVTELPFVEHRYVRG